MEDELEIMINGNEYLVTYVQEDNQIYVYYEGIEIGSTQLNGLSPKTASRTFLVSYLDRNNA